VSRTRPMLAPVLLALSALVLASGCAAGLQAQTVKPYSLVPGGRAIGQFRFPPRRPVVSSVRGAYRNPRWERQIAQA